MALTGGTHKQVGQPVTTADWNALVYANWSELGALDFNGTDIGAASPAIDSGREISAFPLLSSTLIEEDVSAITVTVPVIPHGRHLFLEVLGVRSDRAASVFGGMLLQINDDVTYANYKYIRELDLASGTITVVSSSATVFPLRVPAVNADAGAYGAAEVLIMNYSSAVGPKHIHARTTSPSRTTVE